jgi:hypothetical protein
LASITAARRRASSIDSDATEQADPLAVILAGHPVPHERDLLPRRQNAEDEPPAARHR